MIKNIYLSIVVPVFNEERKIQGDLAVLFNYFEKQTYSFEVIVVNDGSTDKTVKEIDSFQMRSGHRVRIISYEKNRGKGYAVKNGALNASGQIVFFVDAGSCIPYEYTEKGLEILNRGYDLAWGARNMKESIILVQAPFYRRVIGNIFRTFVRALFGLWELTDSQCGFKLFKRESAKEIFGRQMVEGFSFDVELAVLAKKLGYRLKQFPVQWHNDRDSRVRVFSGFCRVAKELSIVCKIKYRRETFVKKDLANL